MIPRETRATIATAENRCAVCPLVIIHSTDLYAAFHSIIRVFRVTLRKFVFLCAIQRTTPIRPIILSRRHADNIVVVSVVVVRISKQ